jgi:glyoxylase-like metal-dependent hydrolase (beta-lactamase superfamily II)
MNTNIVHAGVVQQDQVSPHCVRGRHTRAAFLRRMAAAVLGGIGVSGAYSQILEAADAVSGAKSASSERQQPGSGKKTAVHRWDIVTIGNLSRNRYWGESDSKALRSAICTCTLIQGEGFRLLVDPSLGNAEEMAKELDRRCGLKLRDVDTVFITHEHGDHWYGLPHFPKARWLAGPDVAAALNKTGKLPQRVEATGSTILDAVEVIATPGHTLSHHSLRFHCDRRSVVVAGDAVATRDFWRERRGYFNCVDFDLSARTMKQLSSLADIIVPGHDNYFLNLDADPRPGNSP